LAACWPVMRLWAIRTSNGTQLVGDVAAVQAITPGVARISRRERVWRLVAASGGQIGLTILGVLAGLTTVLDLLRGHPVWAGTSTTPVFLATWLAGCAAALWARQVVRWAAPALSVVALVVLALRPSVGLPFGF